MRIIYALSGEGRGHGSLARAVVPVLQGAGHVCKLVTYGQSLPQLTEFDVVPIPGIRHLYDRHGRLSLSRSFAGNVSVLCRYVTGWRRIRRAFVDFAPDVVVVNFEPFVPLLARSLGTRVVSFDNQHALLHLAGPVAPVHLSSARIARTAIRCVAPWAEHYVVLTFAQVGTGNSRVHVVPPVVNPDIRRASPARGEHVVVYLKHPNRRLLELLKQRNEHYLVYGYDAAATDLNLTYRPYNSGMPAELAAAKAVIGTAGMSLVSEAVWLKKPFFGIPLKNEFEQMVNAMAVGMRGFGAFAEDPTAGQIASFFANLDRYRAALDAYRFDTDAAGRKLLELIGTGASTRVTLGSAPAPSGLCRADETL